MNRIVHSNHVEDGGTSRESPDLSLVAPQGSDQATLTQFNLISKEGQQTEEDMVKNLLQRVFTVFDSLDAGGKPLSLVYSGKQKMESLKQWIICLDVWGCYLPVLPGDLGLYRARAEDKLKLAIEDLNAIFHEHEYSTNGTIVEICREIKDIEICLTKLLHYVQSRFESLSSNKSSQASTVPEQIHMTKGKFEYARVGYLIPLTCGHSGPYNTPEKLLYEAHLSRVRFID